MSETAALTLEVSQELKDKITRLAEATGRTPSTALSRDIEAAVDHQLWMLSEIEKSQEDFRQGRTVSHADAMERIRATIERHRPLE